MKRLGAPHALAHNMDLKIKTILNVKRQNVADAEINIFPEFLIIHFWLTCSETSIFVKGSVYGVCACARILALLGV